VAAQPRLAADPLRASVIILNAGCQSLATVGDAQAWQETEKLPVVERLKRRWERRTSDRIVVYASSKSAVSPVKGGTSYPHLAVGELTVRGDGRFSDFQMGEGTLLQRARLNALNEELGALRDVSYAVVSDKLAAAGALYAPARARELQRRAEAFFRAIEPVIGRSHVTKVKFAWKVEPNGISINWEVNAVTDLGPISARFDPLQGNLIAAHLASR
jgi:hypothetical protein